jgi:hypothetical protein
MADILEGFGAIVASKFEEYFLAASGGMTVSIPKTGLGESARMMGLGPEGSDGSLVRLQCVGQGCLRVLIKKGRNVIDIIVDHQPRIVPARVLSDFPPDVVEAHLDLYWTGKSQAGVEREPHRPRVDTESWKQRAPEPTHDYQTSFIGSSKDYRI